jgi:hypothetical protein
MGMWQRETETAKASAYPVGLFVACVIEMVVLH